MRSADKVALVNTLNGANTRAGTASGTLGIIDGGEIVLDRDSSLGTCLLALSAADTAVGAYLSGKGTLIVVGALHHNSGGIVYKMDNAVGALSGTNSAADALSGIDLGNAVLDGDSVLGADAHTVAVAEAGEGAGTVALIGEVCGTAGALTAIVILLLHSIAGAVAGNVSNSLYNILCLNAHNGSNLLGNAVTAGHTEVGLGGLSLGKSLCIAVTAGITAGTAVGTGQAITDSKCALVLLYCKEDRRHGKEHRTNNGSSEKYQNCI